MNSVEKKRLLKEKFMVEEKKECSNNDLEMFNRFAAFALDDVYDIGDLDHHTKMMAVLASLLGCQGANLFERMAEAALDTGVSAVEIKELLYQAIAYLGYGRVYPFLNRIDQLLDRKGIMIPLESRSTTTMEDRLEKGEQLQVDIFGESMKGFSDRGPVESKHINRWLSENCFGNYYTRKGLDIQQREMITFCFLAAQGGCEPQLISHAEGNMRIGNDRIFLIQIISQCIPYIGYPRVLNAWRCIEEADKKLNKHLLDE